MLKRSVSVTLVGYLFICVGIGSGVGGVWRFRESGSAFGNAGFHETRDLFIVLVSALLALAGGIGVLRGHNWARWLCILWMGFHVVKSMSHPPLELIIHFIFFLLIFFALYRSTAAAYFRNAS